MLFINATSGGGKAQRAGLADLAREQDIEPVTLARGESLEDVIQEVAAGGAEALGVAGGDGSLAAGAQSLSVEASGAVPAGVDGEAVTLAPPLHFRIHPRALRVRIAPGHVRPPGFPAHEPAA